MATKIHTGKVQDRRALRFQNVDEVLGDVDRIVAADQAGTLQRLGNWTPGQILGHLAAWIEYAYDGYPLKAPPWIVRVVLRMRKNKYLRDGLPSGVEIPGVAGGTTGTELLSTPEGADRLRRALQRLASDEPVKFDSPALGALSHEDRIQLNLRHAELHLSFLKY